MATTPDDAAAVEAVFHAALERPRHQRDEFLVAECAGKPALLAEVRSLLAAHDGAGRFLDEPAEVPDLAMLTDVTGRRFGNYVVRERIGSGGMSDVYLAERTEAEFDQLVAVKIVRRGLSDTEVLRRFRTECRILAMLEHPNIARMIDGGLDTDQTPYLVMEYVDGVPITEYCRDAALSIEERLRLFITVCEAVHHAHKHSTIHRDLKPSNVLVDRDGNVKLLDFGIARILSLPEADDDVTATGLRVMTPAYASPEQIRGERLSTATDVYSLGALLYKLLTDKKPLELDNLPLPELARVVSQVLPVEPSTVLRSTSTESREQQRLGRRLMGDIDTIVMMALRKEPDRRYSSAEQFADDLRKHLDRRPVLAQPDTIRYLVQTFVRRNAGFVTLGLAVFALLLTAAIGGPMLYARAERARQDAQLAQQRAEQNAATAERTTQLIVDLFRSSDPKAARGETITAREVLRRGSERLEENLKDEPIVYARLLHTLGDVYLALGLHDDASAMLTKSIELNTTHGGSPLAIAESLGRIAVLMELKGEIEEALKTAQRSVSLREEHASAGAHQTATARVPVGHLLYVLGRYADSRKELDRALSDLEALGVDALELSAVQMRLSATLEKLGEGPESVELAQKALAVREAHLDPLDPEISEALDELAIRLVSEGRREEAIPLRRRSFAITEKVYGRDHPQLIDITFSIGFDEYLAGRFEAAGQIFERGRQLVESSYGIEHRRYGRFLVMLARVDVEMGNVESANERSRRALAIHEVAHGRDNPQIGAMVVIRGVVLLGIGRPEEARPILERALGLVAEAYGTTHWRYGVTLGFVATLERQLGNHERALQLFERTNGILDAALSEDDPRRADHLIQWAIAMARSGDVENAKTAFANGMARLGEARASYPARLLPQIQFWADAGDLERAKSLVQRYVTAGHPTGQLRNNRDYAAARPLLEDIRR